MAGTSYAANAEKEIGEISGFEETALVLPCTGYIIVRDHSGSIVYSEGYGSNGPDKAGCSDGFLKELQSVLAVYPASDYSYESDVNWEEPK